MKKKSKIKATAAKVQNDATPGDTTIDRTRRMKKFWPAEARAKWPTSPSAPAMRWMAADSGG